MKCRFSASAVWVLALSATARVARADEATGNAAGAARDDPSGVPYAAAGAETRRSRDEPDDPIDAARAAFLRALELAREERYAEAIAEFRESERLRPHPITSYDIGYCERKLGHHSNAFRAFVHALTPGSTGEQLPAGFEARARQDVVDAATAMGRVRISGDRARLRVDGHPVESLDDEGQSTYLIAEGDAERREPPDSFELLVDPGEHVVGATTSEGAPLLEIRVLVESGSVTNVVVPTAAPAPPRVVEQTAESPSPRPVPVDEPRAIARRPDRTLAYVALSTSAAGFVASGVFAALALSDEGYLDDSRCPQHQCPNAYASRVDRMQRFATFATVALGVGVAGGLGGAYLWFSARPKAPPAGALSVEPWIGLSSAGLRGRF
ncbi:MAG TPA: hypothetical protein VHC69_19625 [Polyangiaceae bacterium]|nr:hypothetical protein [Polyangiaceae bacterium]